MFHCFIYYVNSSTEYFSNWLGHETPPLPPSLHVSLLHKGTDWTARWWELPFGWHEIIFISNLFHDNGHTQRESPLSQKCLVGND